MKRKLKITLFILSAWVLIAAKPLPEVILSPGESIEVRCKDDAIPTHIAEHGRVAVWCD